MKKAIILFLILFLSLPLTKVSADTTVCSYNICTVNTGIIDTLQSQPLTVPATILLVILILGVVLIINGLILKRILKK